MDRGALQERRENHLSGHFHGADCKPHQNDFFIQNRSFLRLKNIELGYTLPGRFLSKVGVKALRVYVSGQNLFVWDNLRITHIDPEQDNSYGYPITRNVTLGVNINF